MRYLLVYHGLLRSRASDSKISWTAPLRGAFPDVFRPEGAQHNSPGHRPGYLSKRQSSAALQLDFRVAGVDGHTSAAWVGEPPVRKIWGLVALDPSHPILILSRNAALVGQRHFAMHLCRNEPCCNALLGYRYLP